MIMTTNMIVGNIDVTKKGLLSHRETVAAAGAHPGPPGTWIVAQCGWRRAISF